MVLRVRVVGRSIFGGDSCCLIVRGSRGESLVPVLRPFLAKGSTGFADVLEGRRRREGGSARGERREGLEREEEGKGGERASSRIGRVEEGVYACLHICEEGTELSDSP